MRISAVAAFAASLYLAGAGVALAADSSTGMMHGAASTKARCSPGDPNVLVNKTAKTFVLDAKAKAPAKGASATAPMLDANATSKSTAVSMCKSEALSMGAKMASGTKKSGM